MKRVLGAQSGWAAAIVLAAAVCLGVGPVWAKQGAGAYERLAAFTVESGTLETPVEPVRIEPSAATIPANTLRFYIYFSANARGIFRQSQVTIIQADGAPVPDPFVDFGQELWSKDGTRLTLLLDPGRIKRGVSALEAQGAVLKPGSQYRVEITWTDATGKKQEFAHGFSASDANRTPMDVRRWIVLAPVVNTMSPLNISFDRAMDQATLEDSLLVVTADGRPVEGSVAIERNRRWQFTPNKPWRPGLYRVAVLNRLEDVSGNRVGEALDHDLGAAESGPLSASLTFRPRSPR